MSNNPQYCSDDGILTKQTKDRASFKQQHVVNILDPSMVVMCVITKKQNKTK